ncbi:hypothetical protein [Ottowia sp.]|uniref:hypothetical protein n=1 Tax=Ottowia sp. TaxID=1898956 RepID=UPI0025E5FE80|nr:hypothetical protein [Ottowia sp.]MBK6616675.1 hypothetical protein [Ottowia sp.]
MNAKSVNKTVYALLLAASAVLSGCGGGDAESPETTRVLKLATRSYGQTPSTQEMVGREVDALRAAGADSAEHAACYMRFEAQPPGTFFLMVDVALDQIEIAQRLAFLPAKNFSSSTFTAVSCTSL